MAQYLREKSPNFKFSLHDAKIIDIDYDYGENRLIFKTQSGFIDVERNEMVRGRSFWKAYPGMTPMSTLWNIKMF